jgi:hypothetical protein
MGMAKFTRLPVARLVQKFSGDLDDVMAMPQTGLGIGGLTVSGTVAANLSDQSRAGNDFKPNFTCQNQHKPNKCWKSPSRP